MSQRLTNPGIRNIAIIAHVDHGKTTLVDHMFRQSGLFRDNQQVGERLMDRLDIERERGITIAAKNCSIDWRGTKINIIDTPGHADFGGEVERTLTMVDGAVLLVDAAEGPLPQTRFVLRKALELNLAIIVAINKIDRKDARPVEVLDEVYELFLDLDADEDQIGFPVVYTVGRDGVATDSLDVKGTSLDPLMDKIVSAIPPPSYDPDEPFQMLVADLDYSDFVGRLAIGRIVNGSVRKNDALVCVDGRGDALPLRATRLQVYQGIDIVETTEATPGEVLILAGIENVYIGDTICTAASPKALQRIRVDDPIVSMRFAANTSPQAGLEGTIVQSTRIRERLAKESLRNVAIQVEEAGDEFVVKGRGEFQLAILVETLRREGFELMVGRPQVILRKDGRALLEPIEHLYIDCNEEFMGIVTEKLTRRKGRMVNMVNHGTGRIRMEFDIPSRGLIGYRNDFLTDTKGTGLMNAYLKGHEPHRGPIASRVNGSIVSDRAGVAVGYAIYNLEPRGTMFVVPGDRVYEGMIVGEHNRDSDLNVNPTREKKQTNMRAAGSDENIILTPVTPFTIERAIDFIRDDELVEVTPKSIRLRKEVLSADGRARLRARREDQLAPVS